MVLFVKNLLFTVFVPGTVAVTIPWLLAGSLRPPAFGAATALPYLVLAGGLALVLECVWQFGRRGRGTPFIADPPKSLVVYGPYRWTRNPMYWGVLAIISGEALLFHSGTLAAYAMVVAAMFHLFVVFFEERWLAARFGASYQDYLGQVNRWLPRRPSR